MSGDNFQDPTPVYSFQGSSPSAEFLEIARIHHREAKQLLESAHAAEAEDRKEEAKLLMDLAIARRERAEEFERAARGEGGDPIVAEILDGQQEVLNSYTPYTPTDIQTEGKLPEGWMEEYAPPPSSRIARAVAWIGGLIAK
jgi:acyl-CoA reductase-like NAD-dependent aldehyde dehydrogenase